MTKESLIPTGNNTTAPIVLTGVVIPGAESSADNFATPVEFPSDHPLPEYGVVDDSPVYYPEPIESPQPQPADPQQGLVSRSTTTVEHYDDGYTRETYVREGYGQLPSTQVGLGGNPSESNRRSGKKSPGDRRGRNATNNAVLQHHGNDDPEGHDSVPFYKSKSAIMAAKVGLGGWVFLSLGFVGAHTATAIAGQQLNKATFGLYGRISGYDSDKVDMYALNKDMGHNARVAVLAPVEIGRRVVSIVVPSGEEGAADAK